VGRLWRVPAPNRLVVADFTYVPMTCGFGYTAFVVDAYAGLIPGWECSLTKDTAFVQRALRHAAAYRARQGHPFDETIHHSDAGSQYTAMHFGETLMLAGLQPSVGTVGDALDRRLMHRLARRPPAEIEAEYFARLQAGKHTGHP
jgi:putative transposase